MNKKILVLILIVLLILVLLSDYFIFNAIKKGPQEVGFYDMPNNALGVAVIADFNHRL